MPVVNPNAFTTMGSEDPKAQSVVVCMYNNREVWMRVEGKIVWLGAVSGSVVGFVVSVFEITFQFPILSHTLDAVSLCHRILQEYCRQYFSNPPSLLLHHIMYGLRDFA
ncbi:hypothetical protein FRB94_001355 [Tulasnella sp. JGI-2019a]|nr:hypothetical protein FRB94_001355 [Tulasnella sp. JGI-2019a]